LRWNVVAVAGVVHHPVIHVYVDRIDRRQKRRLEPQVEEVAEAEQPLVVVAE
jgi:HAE1 family hydrophobic/amphiphilic exporter-1